ncbi:hypothetical protein PINS_up021461 [Pythium insidiosum]|nr:hypothetical protein PINS_up021461 [Pythium insidiosum]
MATSIDDVLACRSFRERKSLLATKRAVELVVEPVATPPVPIVTVLNEDAKEDDVISVLVDGLLHADQDGSEQVVISLVCDSDFLFDVSVDGLGSRPITSEPQPSSSTNAPATNRQRVTLFSLKELALQAAQLSLRTVTHRSGLLHCEILATATDRAGEMVDAAVKTTSFHVRIRAVGTKPVLSVVNASFVVQEDTAAVLFPVAASLVDRDSSELLLLVFDVGAEFNKSVHDISWVPDPHTVNDAPGSGSSGLGTLNGSSFFIVSAGNDLGLAGALRLVPRIGFSGSLRWKVTAIAIERVLLSDDSSIDYASVFSNSLGTSTSLVAGTDAVELLVDVMPICHAPDVELAAPWLVTTPTSPIEISLKASTPDTDGSEVVSLVLRSSSVAVQEVRVQTVSDASSPPSWQVMETSAGQNDSLLYRIDPSSSAVYRIQQVFSVLPRFDFMGIFTVDFVVTTTELETGEQRSVIRSLAVMVAPAEPKMKPVPVLHAPWSENPFVRLPFNRSDLEVVKRDTLLLVVEDSTAVAAVYAGLQYVEALPLGSMDITSTAIRVFQIPYSLRHRVLLHLQRNTRSAFIRVHFIVSTKSTELPLGDAIRIGLSSAGQDGDGVGIASLVITMRARVRDSDIAEFKQDILPQEDGGLLSISRNGLSVGWGVRTVDAVTSVVGVETLIPPSLPLNTVISSVPLTLSSGPIEQSIQTFALAGGPALVALTSLSLRSQVWKIVDVRVTARVWDIAKQESASKTQVTKVGIYGTFLAPFVSFSAPIIEIADDAAWTVSLFDLGVPSWQMDMLMVEVRVPSGAVDNVSLLNAKTVAYANATATADSPYDTTFVLSIRSRLTSSSDALVVRPLLYLSQQIPITISFVSTQAITQETHSLSSASRASIVTVLSVLPTPNSPVIQLDSKSIIGDEERPVSFPIRSVFTPDQDGSEVIELIAVVRRTAISDILVGDSALTMSVNATSGDASATIVFRSTGVSMMSNVTLTLVPQLDFNGASTLTLIARSIERATGAIAETLETIAITVNAMQRATLPLLDVTSQVTAEDTNAPLVLTVTPQRPNLRYTTLVWLPTAIFPAIRLTTETSDLSCSPLDADTALSRCLVRSEAVPTTDPVRLSLSISAKKKWSGRSTVMTTVLAYTDDISAATFLGGSCFLAAKSSAEILRCRTTRERKSLLAVDKAVEIAVAPVAEPPNVVVEKTVPRVDENADAAVSISNITLADTDGSEVVTVALVCGDKLFDQVKMVQDGTTSVDPTTVTMTTRDSRHRRIHTRWLRVVVRSQMELQRLR